MIEIRCHAEPGGLVIEVLGDLTEMTAPVLDSCLAAAVEADLRRLVLDVRAVRRIDRPAALTLLELDRRLRRVGGSLAVRNLDACIDTVADMMTLDADHGSSPSPPPPRGHASLDRVAAQTGALTSSPSLRARRDALST